MMQSPDIRRAIAAMGRNLSPDMLAAVQDLFRAELEADVERFPPVVVDAAYGPDQRQKLDLYSAGARASMPILVWVHGGGFLRGAKSAPDHPYQAHIGRFAARHGMLGAVINYRLAPDHAWPSGIEDLQAVLDWLKAHGPAHGGDPDRIVLMGTSAGAAHIASYLKANEGREAIRAAVLLSGLFGFTAYEDRDRLYLGQDPAGDTERFTRDTIARTNIPLFIACTEYDPPRFQQETLSALSARLSARGDFSRGMLVSGHNHFSISSHIGTSDMRLSDEILGFLADVNA